MRIKHERVPWFNREANLIIGKRNKLYALYRQANCGTAKTIYKDFEKKAKNYFQKATTLKENNSIEQSDGLDVNAQNLYFSKLHVSKYILTYFK